MPDGRSSRLAGRTALVTGAGNGLGRAISLQLAQAGVRVIATGRTAGSLEETAALVSHPGRGAIRVAEVDVSDEDSVGRLATSLADEEISILINNAGVPGPVASLVDIE